MMEAYYLYKVDGRENKGYLPILVILLNRACQTSMGFHAIYTHKGNSFHSNCYLYASLIVFCMHICMHVCIGSVVATLRSRGLNVQFKRMYTWRK